MDTGNFNSVHNHLPICRPNHRPIRCVFPPIPSHHGIDCIRIIHLMMMMMMIHDGGQSMVGTRFVSRDGSGRSSGTSPRRRRGGQIMQEGFGSILNFGVSSLRRFFFVIRREDNNGSQRQCE
uniref:Uncharacterized protein n=1 Tax=Amphora coffeiformis TaxID=265554 RepID=A0A7S3L3R5_9STRA